MTMGQVDFDAPLAGRIRADILDAVRKKTGKWSGSCKEIATLRAAMLNAQGRRCFYCRRRIASNEVGLREMDHILPKAQSPSDGFDAKVASDSNFKTRRHTSGYPKFTYEPENLAVSCKRCNSYKGTFDPLRDRANSPKQYPNQTVDFLWIHPFHDLYGDHIKIEGGGIYVKNDGSDKGDAVIKACGLDKSEELTKRLVDDYVRSHMELTDAMLELTILGPFDVEELSEEFAKTYKVADSEVIKCCLWELMASRAGGSGAYQRAFGKVKKLLGLDGPVYAPDAEKVN